MMIFDFAIGLPFARVAQIATFPVRDLGRILPVAPVWPGALPRAGSGLLAPVRYDG